MIQNRVGLVLGGGGEVGIAWEIGVLAALQAATPFRAHDVTVIAGTSAGAVVGAYAALDRDIAALADDEAHGRGFTTPFPIELTPASTDSDPGQPGTAVVPPELMAVLTSQDGSVDERARKTGRLAADLPTAITADDLVDAVAATLGTRDWPEVPFRPTSVNADTGHTVLWDATGPADLATAVASSIAVPGFFPLIPVDGQPHLDGPRTPFTASLVAEYALDAVLFIGLDLPLLSNNAETTALHTLKEDGTRVLAITGGPSVAEVAAELMDPAARPRAVAIGHNDGTAARHAVTSLVDR